MPSDTLTTIAALASSIPPGATAAQIAEYRRLVSTAAAMADESAEARAAWAAMMAKIEAAEGAAS